MVSFMCQLEWVKGCPDNSVCLWGVFPEEICAWIGKLRIADGPPQRGWAPSNPMRTSGEQKGRRRANSLYEPSHPSPALRTLDFSAPGPLAMGLRLRLTPSLLPQLMNWLHQLTSFSSLQMTDLTTLTVWASFYSKSPLMCILLSYYPTVFCFSRETC